MYVRKYQQYFPHQILIQYSPKNNRGNFLIFRYSLNNYVDYHHSQ